MSRRVRGKGIDMWYTVISIRNYLGFILGGYRH